MVSTLRCGQSNPGSNPGYGIIFVCLFEVFAFFSKILNTYEIHMNLQFMKNATYKQIMENLTLIFSMISESCFQCEVNFQNDTEHLKLCLNCQMKVAGEI